MKKIAYSLLLVLVSVAVTLLVLSKKPEFIAVKQLPDGSKYSGELNAAGMFSGKGELNWGSGGVYKGEFLNGLLHGKGKLKYPDGSVYEGDFHQGQMHGKGKIVYSNGMIYEGDFVNDRQEGSGKYSNLDGTQYEGQVKNGQMHGQGKFLYPDAQIYEGNFVDNKMQGKGKYTDESISYEGEFVDGDFSGKGVLTEIETGEIVRGNFQYGRAQGKGSKTDKKGNYWEGNFEHGYLSGKGIYKGADGETYEGYFDYGQYDGEGVLVEKNGDVYKGGFSYGRKEGKGELQLAKPINGQTTVTGVWSYGKLQEASGAYKIYDGEAISDYAIYGQHQRLDQVLSNVEKGNPEKIEIYSLLVAGDGTQEVFNRELNFVSDFLANEFNNKKQSVFLSNTRYDLKAPLATLPNIEKSINAIANKMDVNQDLFFIYMTSHGSEDGTFSLHHKGISLQDLSAEKFSAILKQSKIKNRIIVISACYSGKFINGLKDDHTMVLTSAAANRRSFGCSDERHFTYFGKAYFKIALDKTRDFEKAFSEAKTHIKKWEEKQGEKTPSNPQIYMGSKVRDYLDHWNWGKDQ